jgi:hypothetical protein
MIDDEQEYCEGCDKPLAKGEENPCAECDEQMRPVECCICGDVQPNSEMVNETCPPCVRRAVPFESVTLVVEDVVIKEREVVISSPFCPNEKCRADLRASGALKLRQYEYSEQYTSLGSEEWSGSDSGEGYIALAYVCGSCEEAIAEGSETHLKAEEEILL